MGYNAIVGQWNKVFYISRLLPPKSRQDLPSAVTGVPINISWHVEGSEEHDEDSKGEVEDSEAAAKSILLRVPDMRGFPLFGEARLNV